MSMPRWNVATAKAELSRVLESARREPQLVEKRGRPVAVVIGIEEYERLSRQTERAGRWKEFLDASAELRASGGAELQIPPREGRPSPLRQRRR